MAMANGHMTWGFQCTWGVKYFNNKTSDKILRFLQNKSDKGQSVLVVHGNPRNSLIFLLCAQRSGYLKFE